MDFAILKKWEVRAYSDIQIKNNRTSKLGNYILINTAENE